MNSQVEKDIVEKAKTDIQYFKYLYENYYPLIFAYILFLTGNKSLTEDLVSDTFEKAIINIKNYEDRGYSFGAWLFKIARNLVYDQSSKYSKISLDVLEDMLELPSPKNTEETVICELNKEYLFEAINQLLPSEKEIVMLRYIQEFSIEETSEVTGRTKDSVKSLSKRAIKKLEEILNKKIK